MIADVAGWYAPTPAPVSALTPARVLDTRTGNGAPPAPLGAGVAMDVQVTGRGGVPATGVSAVVLNVTVTTADRQQLPHRLAQPDRPARWRPT